MTLEDIPERLRQPGLILNNGQIIEHTLTEKQTDELAFLLDIKSKKESA
jgi:hypothetical protein